jgi:hypothetical protein
MRRRGMFVARSSTIATRMPSVNANRQRSAVGSVRSASNAMRPAFWDDMQLPITSSSNERRS